MSDDEDPGCVLSSLWKKGSRIEICYSKLIEDTGVYSGEIFTHVVNSLQILEFQRLLTNLETLKDFWTIHCEIVDIFEEDLEDIKKVHEALDK